tara:strand:- start:319 stop:975 length:657 start_codon:yes stop_codon:yes gene_type:complete
MSNKIKFDFVDREELYYNLEVNESLDINLSKCEGFSYYIINNFLKRPKEAIETLKKYPALKGGVTTPGARQNFTPMDLVPILKAYGKILGPKIDPTKFLTCSNISWKGVQVMKNSWYPHSDSNKGDVVCNLWLSDCEGGTSFYKYRNKYTVNDIQPPKRLVPDKLEDWNNFDGDDDWTLYYTIPTKYNSVAVYNGKCFHSPYATHNDDYRYALVSFYG